MKAGNPISIRIALIGALAAAGIQAQIKIACVGNSITAGATLSDPAAQAYPGRLGALLGSGYEVKNEGRSGAYMQKAARAPYWTTSQFKDVFAYKPDIITICLGTNDSRSTQWNRARYIEDYKAMIDTFSTLASKPRIWLVKPMPAWYATKNSSITPDVPGWGFDNGVAGNGISGFVIRDSVIPAIEQVAMEKGLPVIDLYTPMLMGKPYAYTVTPAYVPDGVHPNALGQDSIVRVIYRAISAGTTAIFPNPSKVYRSFPEPRSFTGMMASPSGISGSTRLHSLDGRFRPRPAAHFQVSSRR